MKERKYRRLRVKEIVLNEPEINGNRVTYSWGPNPLLDEAGYWIEYPELKDTFTDTEEMMAPYLPICLAFAVLGNISVRLPFKLTEDIFGKWEEIIDTTARTVYRRKKGFKLINGDRPLRNDSWRGKKTGLLLGGGAESLLTLGYLMEEGIKPVLVTFGQVGWGSDIDRNFNKNRLNRELAREFGLDLAGIKTSFFDLIYSPDDNWSEYLDHDIWGVVISALHMPSILTGVLPIARQLELNRIVNGLEKENDMTPRAYCYSTQAVKHLKGLNKSVSYEAYLEDLFKIEVLRELHTKFPSIAKYQHSCMSDPEKRWCLKCEKCLRNWLGLKIYNIDASSVGMDDAEVRKNLPGMIKAARSSIWNEPSHKKAFFDSFRRGAAGTGNRECMRILDELSKGLWFYGPKRRLSAKKRYLKAVLNNLSLDIFQGKDQKQ